VATDIWSIDAGDGEAGSRLLKSVIHGFKDGKAVARGTRVAAVSLSLRAERSNLGPVAHVLRDCRVASLLAMTGNPNYPLFTRLHWILHNSRSVMYAFRISTTERVSQ